MNWQHIRLGWSILWLRGRERRDWCRRRSFLFWFWYSWESTTTSRTCNGIDRIWVGQRTANRCSCEVARFIKKLTSPSIDKFLYTVLHIMWNRTWFNTIQYNFISSRCHFQYSKFSKVLYSLGRLSLLFSLWSRRESFPSLSLEREASNFNNQTRNTSIIRIHGRSKKNYIQLHTENLARNWGIGRKHCFHLQMSLNFSYNWDFSARCYPIKGADKMLTRRRLSSNELNVTENFQALIFILTLSTFD